VNKNLKFGLLAAIIVGTLGWLAASGVESNASYYKEISEIQRMGNTSVDKRLRVGGDIKAHSITRDGGQVHFTLVQNDQQLQVVYTGIDPLPDTFKDGSQAVADGKLASDGVFHATKVQAKCASKYEAKPTGAITRSGQV
jgi:cytochrome c-type biogenesis protein CcmE